MGRNPFKGMGVAMVTPFNADGSVDFPALRQLADTLINDGADFLCVLGSTGETPCISPHEAARIMQTVVETNGGRVPLLLGMSDNCTMRLTETIKAADLTGFSGILSAAPSYNKPTQEGIYRHFAALSDISPLPIVLYNIPGRTGVNMSAATTLRLARDFKNIIAIKEASGNISQIEDILQGKPEDFDVISGDDAITYELVALGAVGVISVVGNALTKTFSGMVRSLLGGDHKAALAAHRRLGTVYKLMSVDGNPSGIKALLSIQGRIGNVLRLPLVPATADTYAKLEKAAAELQIP